MADLERTIDIVFGGIDNTGSALQSVSSGISSLENKVSSVTGPLADFSKNILSLEVAALSVGAAMAGVAINEAGQFGDSVAEIGTLFNGTTEQVDILKQQIIEYSRDSVSSIDEINASVYKAISTGTDWADAVTLVSDAEVLATAGRADLMEVTSVLTGVMNAYGAEVSLAGDYSDVLFTAVQKGNTTIPELAQYMGQVAGVASAAQVPFDDLSAAMSALTIYIGSTSESTTRMKALLTELLKPSDELTAALAGVSLQTDGLDGVMRQLLVATGGSAEQMVQLFGSTEAVQAALALANDKSGAFASALDSMANRAGVAAGAADALDESFENINQNLLNNLKATLIEFGGPLLDEYGANAEAIGNIFEGISISFDSKNYQPVLEALEQLGIDSAELLQGIADALPAAFDQVKFEGLLEALGDLRTSFGDLFGDLDLSKPEDLAKVLQFLTDGFETLTRLSSGIIDGLQPFVQLIGDLINKVNSAEDPTKAFVGEILGLATGLDATLVPALGVASAGLEGLANIVLTLAGAKHLGLAITGVKGLALALGGGGGLVAAIGLGVIGIGEWMDAIDRTNELQEEMRRSAEASAKAWEGAANWEEYVARLGEMGESVSFLNDAFMESYGVTADAVAQYGSVTAALEAQKAASVDAVQAIVDKVNAEKEAAGVAGEVAQNYDDLVDSVEQQTHLNEQQAKSAEDLRKEWELMTIAQTAALSEEERAIYVRAISADTTDAAAESSKKLTQAQIEEQLTAKELSDARLRELEIMNDYNAELEKLASAERIRQMELIVDFNIEQLKADSERAQAIIEGLNTTVESTGALLGELFGLLGQEGQSFRDRWAIEEQIDLENERRQQALDLQTDLTEKQIELMDAQISNLESGDGLIKIQADGLEPEIRAFMYRILDNIRIEMSRDNLAFITGVQG